MPPKAFRFAHPTNDLEQIERFYGELLGLKRIARFTGHDGFSGNVYALPDERHQLEFTSGPDTAIVPWSAETLFVRYYDDRFERAEVESRLEFAGVQRVAASFIYTTQAGHP
jgi:catechol 2,3-dioxygenase-like lactoylglutathione lyase family enzyme